MNKRQFEQRTGLSDKTVRDWVANGWLKPTAGKRGAWEFAESDVPLAAEIAADVKAGKRRRNRDHRTAVIASQWDRERAAGGKTAQQAVRLLAKGEAPAVIFRRMAENGRDITRMDWSLLIEVYKLAYGTSNAEELSERHAPLPQTLVRIRNAVLAELRGKPQKRSRRRGAVKVRRVG